MTLTHLEARFTPDVLKKQSEAVIAAIIDGPFEHSPLVSIAAGVPPTPLQQAANSALYDAMGDGRVDTLRQALTKARATLHASAVEDSGLRSGTRTPAPDSFTPYVGTVDGYYVRPNSAVLGLISDHPEHFTYRSRTLDLGAGSGRHALSAAMVGATVDAIDASAAGTDFTRRQARELGMRRVRALCADMREFELGQGLYDVVIASTSLEHIPAGDRGDLAKRIVRSMRPDGILYAKVFLDSDPGALDRTRDASETAGFVADHFAPRELGALFSELDIFTYREFEWVDLTHGSPHTHVAAELVARKG